MAKEIDLGLRCEKFKSVISFNFPQKFNKKKRIEN